VTICLSKVAKLEAWLESKEPGFSYPIPDEEAKLLLLNYYHHGKKYEIEFSNDWKKFRITQLRTEDARVVQYKDGESFGDFIKRLNVEEAG
jgi:hypothetical protein